MSKTRVRGLVVFAVSLCLAALPGCSGKSAVTISLTATPPSSDGSPVTCGTSTTSSCSVTVKQGELVTIAASVANDKTNAGVTWGLGSSVGSLSSQSTTSVTYVAPTALTTNTTATVTATSVASTTVTQSVTITVNAVFEFETSSLPVATEDVPYSATISTIGATGPFTWIILSGSLPAGLTLSNSNTASVNITGTPSAVGSSTVTIQATDSTGTPIQRTFTITVNPPPALTIITPSTITPGTVGQAYSYTLQAEFGTPPYTWTLTGTGSLPNGIQLKNGVLTGTPTAAGTSTFGVQVQDSATPNPAIATKNLTLTVNQVSANQDLTGNYAFLVSGFDLAGKRFAAAGSFAASGGNISAGEIDINDAGATDNRPGTGAYSIDANGLGTLSFAGLTFYMSFVPTSNNASITAANLIEFDSVTQAASGVLLQQTTPFGTPSGNYAFGFLGADASNNRYALAGAFPATPGGAGLLDLNDAGAPKSTAFNVLNFGGPDANGRGTFSFSVSNVASDYA
ncbi:MAG: YbbR-like domain-containing protein, partial [Acidobacteriaceae bacterium]|nr:YbbR-like domain-containing protein [Acidobacteriaceae bacterium]